MYLLWGKNIGFFIVIFVSVDRFLFFFEFYLGVIILLFGDVKCFI